MPKRMPARAHPPEITGRVVLSVGDLVDADLPAEEVDALALVVGLVDPDRPGVTVVV